MRALVLLLTLAACSEPADAPADAPANAPDGKATAGEPTGIHFTDTTRGSGLELKLTSGEDPPTRLMESMGSGVALIDYDNDGDQDVFVPNGATLGAPDAGPGSRLFENLGELRFQDVTERAGIVFRRWAGGACVGDYDGDGFDDLFVTCYGRNALLRNTGDGRFVETTSEAGITGIDWSTGAAFGDLDADGDLDLYLVNYARLSTTGKAPLSEFLGAMVLAGPSGLPAVPDVLWVNQGDGTFVDGTEAWGLGEVEARWGLGAVILDFDGDGTLDICVGNDSQPNFMLENTGEGRLEEVGTMGGIALNEDGAAQATMGIAVGDIDGNGLADIFTTNFMFDTNTLHLNTGKHTYEDRTRQYGLFIDSRPYLSWATGFFDFDNDGDEDVIYFNGHIYPEDLCRERGWNYRQVPVLRERRGARFERLSADTAGDWLAEPYCDRGAAFGDLDNDGDVDILVAERNGPLRLLRNDRDGGNWLSVALDDRRPGHERRGWGSKVSIRSGAQAQHRWLASGASFYSSNQARAHFGLPAETEAVSVRVVWPDGHEQAVEGVSPRQAFVVTRE